MSTWPLWTDTPPVGEIVHIVAMGHMNEIRGGAHIFSVLPDGFFAEVCDDDDDDDKALPRFIYVLTKPASLLTHPKHNNWSWGAPFPFDFLDDPHSNSMRFERVPADIQDAVRAFVALQGGPPVIVEDGWMREIRHADFTRARSLGEIEDA